MEKNVVAKSNKKLIAILLVAIIAVVGVYFVFLKKNSSPKSIFTKAINKEYEKFMDAFEVDEKKLDKAVVVDQKIDFDIDIDKSIIGADGKKMIDELNKLGLSVTTAFDSKKSEGIFDLAATYDKKDLIALALYLTENKGYVELKNLFDKYIEVDMDSSELLNVSSTASFDKKDAKYLVKSVKDNLLDSLEEKQFKKSTEKIDVNGKETKLSKITLGLSEKDANQLAIKFIKNVKEDKKFIKIMAKQLDMKESDLKEMLNQSVKSLEENKDLSTEDILFISVYAKGNNPIGFGLEAEDAEFRIIEDNKNKSTLTVKSGEVEIPFVIEKVEKGNTTEYKVSVDFQGLKASISLKSEEIKKDKEYKLTFTIKAMDMIDVKITDEVEVEFKDKLDMPEFKNTVKAENISEEDSNKIMAKLSENETIMEFVKALGSM